MCLQSCLFTYKYFFYHLDDGRTPNRHKNHSSYVLAIQWDTKITCIRKRTCQELAYISEGFVNLAWIYKLPQSSLFLSRKLVSVSNANCRVHFKRFPLVGDLVTMSVPSHTFIQNLFPRLVIRGVFRTLSNI